VLKTGSLSGFVCHFDVNFAKNLIEKVKNQFKSFFVNCIFFSQVHFSTSPRSPPTHWKQTVFFLPRIYNVEEGSRVSMMNEKSFSFFLGEEILGKIICQRHPKEKRGLIIHLHVFDSKFKYYLE
jgi:hypothetical protein